MFDLYNDKKLYFHYCSLDTFLKIIDSNTLRLSNPYKMNDSEELVWSFGILKENIEKHIDKISDIEMKERYRYFYQEAIWDIYDNDFLGTKGPHISCFSEDGDILSQWRLYADDGRGVAIGFDASKLIEPDSGILIFDSVCYNIMEQKERVEGLLESSGFFDPKEIEFKRMKHLYTSGAILMDSILTQSIFNKNPAFSEEKEGRLIYFPSNDFPSQRYDAEKKMEIKGPCFRTNGEDIISYYDLDFSKIKKELIKKIYIGPKSKVTEFDIKVLLTEKGYLDMFDKMDIVKSEASYR